MNKRSRCTKHPSLTTKEGPSAKQTESSAWSHNINWRFVYTSEAKWRKCLSLEVQWQSHSCHIIQPTNAKRSHGAHKWRNSGNNSPGVTVNDTNAGFTRILRNTWKWKQFHKAVWVFASGADCCVYTYHVVMSPCKREWMAGGVQTQWKGVRHKNVRRARSKCMREPSEVTKVGLKSR